MALGLDGFLYATTHGGKVLRISPAGRTVDVFAQPGGRPLGIEVDTDGSLLIANAVLGIQRISTDGVVSDVLTELDGTPLLYADDLAIARDGTIYLSEASTKFGAYASGGTLEGSLLDILEHGGNGLVVEYKPDTGVARVIMDGRILRTASRSATTSAICWSPKPGLIVSIATGCRGRTQAKAKSSSTTCRAFRTTSITA